MFFLKHNTNKLFMYCMQKRATAKACKADALEFSLRRQSVKPYATKRCTLASLAQHSKAFVAIAHEQFGTRAAFSRQTLQFRKDGTNCHDNTAFYPRKYERTPYGSLIACRGFKKRQKVISQHGMLNKDI